MKRRTIRGSFTLLSCFVALVACACACACSAGEPGASPTPPAPDAALPEVPCTPIAASTETVQVKNDLGVLEGTLDVPDGCGSLPVVIIASGSGLTNRDGNVPGDPKNPAIYRVLAQTLRDAGFAALRYDDPGTGKSVKALPTHLEDFRFEMEIDDLGLFVARLRQDKRFRAVVVAGHSQGSLTAIMTHAKQPLDGFISLAGAGRPIGKVLSEQMARRLTVGQMMQLDAAIAKLEKGELVGPLTPPLDEVLPVEMQPYLISWMKVDPRAEVAKVGVPTLLLQGKMDTQVQVLDAQLLEEGKPDATLVLVDDMGHMLRRETAKGGAVQKASYSEPLPLHPDAVAAMKTFLTSLPR